MTKTTNCLAALIAQIVIKFALNYEINYNITDARKNSAITLCDVEAEHTIKIKNKNYDSVLMLYFEKLPKYIRLTVTNRTKNAIIQDSRPDFSNVYYYAEISKVYKIKNFDALNKTLKNIENNFNVNLITKSAEITFSSFDNPCLVKKF